MTMGDGNVCINENDNPSKVHVTGLERGLLIPASYDKKHVLIVKLTNQSLCLLVLTIAIVSLANEYENIRSVYRRW